jgi:hypothetical protein
VTRSGESPRLVVREQKESQLRRPFEEITVPDPSHFDDPDYVADIMLVGTVYSTATVAKPWVPTNLLLERFRQAGGTPAQYEAGLRYALEADWLVMDETGTSVEFGQAGIVLYS